MAGILVVFDFDKTIIQLDSDNWVVDELDATEVFNLLLPNMHWTSLMDKMMRELHARGKTIKEIKEVLRKAPIHPRTIKAIKTAHALGCDLRIVSDANMFFIDTILDHHRIKDCFSEINSNPSHVDEKGRLRISPYVDFNTSPHGCNLCPPNMCKGKIIERIQADETRKRVIYLGDGVGDFCPSLKLKDGDFVMPRKNFPVWDLICNNRALLKAGIYEWDDGNELERVLLELVDKTSNPNSVDCVFAKALPPSVRVHQ